MRERRSEVRLSRLGAHVLQARACARESQSCEQGEQEPGVIEDATVRRVPGCMLAVEWSAESWSYRVRCFWGTVPDKQRIINDAKLLFIGWCDAQANVVMVEDPDPAQENLYFVLEDAATLASSDVFTFT
eukprot:gnl/TRDRNA2_/TRDRNA2_127550_c0_seq2.p1 gnl/TRDRNA2_/TRDRNA2_127550_c0~~gnl/TRDRNA2_/TRDRNA2_127550_c0_seq2.p1  ORF type:complete len:130 (+),score=23.53 gnl/TRDRNA2_/TRDRNA2_127550_c0_seq2:103-492(+)